MNDSHQCGFGVQASEIMPRTTGKRIHTFNCVGFLHLCSSKCQFKQSGLMALVTLNESKNIQRKRLVPFY